MTSAFCIQKRRKLQQEGKLNIAISKPADEEDPPTFSLGLDFLTPEKQAKKKKKKEKQKTSKAAVFAFRKSK